MNHTCIVSGCDNELPLSDDYPACADHDYVHFTHPRGGYPCRCPNCVRTREEIEMDLAIDDTWVDLDDMRVWSRAEQEPDGDWRDYNAF